MKVVVTTPTGHVGSRVVQLLCQAGIRPHLLMRDPGKLDAALRVQVDAVAVDQGNADDVVAATTGAEKRHGAGEIDGLARTEELLNETGADVIHLRCGYFFTNLLMNPDGLRAGVLQTAMPADVPMPWVDPRDVGDVAAARLLSDWTGQQVQAVHGPADLSFAGVAEILGEVLGRALEARNITDDELRGQLRTAGLGEGQIEGIVGMSAGLREDFVPEQERSVLTTTPTTPTTLRSWAYENLRSLT